MTRIKFMGSHSRRLWWDVRWRGGWLVIRAGFIGKPKLPRIYWSPNGTPWHHAARSVFRARYVDRQECVCRGPECTNPTVLST